MGAGNGVVSVGFHNVGRRRMSAIPLSRRFSRDARCYQTGFYGRTFNPSQTSKGTQTGDLGLP